jgi:hypothetical protein
MVRQGSIIQGLCAGPRQRRWAAASHAKIESTMRYLDVVSDDMNRSYGVDDQRITITRPLEEPAMKSHILSSLIAGAVFSILASEPATAAQSSKPKEIVVVGSKVKKAGGSLDPYRANDRLRSAKNPEAVAIPAFMKNARKAKTSR